MISEITILVSCPDDVSDEKNIVIDVCDRFNSSNSALEWNIRYRALDWRNIVGDVGVRGQEQINVKFGDYNIYIGILWRRFGGNTGKINPNTGVDYGSGTYEEFCYACERKKQNPNSLRILVFFKKPNAINSDKNAIQQLKKVEKFKSEVEKLGWSNSFSDKVEFSVQVFLFLLDYAHEFVKFQKAHKVQISVQGVLSPDFFTSISKNFVELSYFIRRTVTNLMSRSTRIIALHQKLDNEKFLSQVIQKNKRIVLLGEAGTGKSIELQQLFLEYLHTGSTLIPVYKRFNNYVDEPIENFLPKGWENIEQDLLLILLDGLDEIEPKNFSTAIARIHSFIEKFAKARIVISSRINFVELPTDSFSGTLSGFEYFRLDAISRTQVEEYLQNTHQISGTHFMQEAQDYGYLELIQKPFFLQLLIKHYQENSTLDVSRAIIFEEYIKTKIKLDRAHFPNHSLFREQRITLLENLQRIALIMENLGRNYLFNPEIKKIVGTAHYSNLRFFTGLNKRDEDENVIWSFEHNNIQEYLAAKALSEKGFETVKSLISFAPEHVSVKPTWLNTLSFWIGITNNEEQHKLIDWLKGIDPEIIVRFEQSRLTPSTRFEIFKSIYSNYKEKRIWLRSNKFELKKLANFPDATEVITFLMKELKSSHVPKIVILNAVELLGLIDYSMLDSLKDKVVESIIKVLKQYKDSDIAWQILYSLSNFAIKEKDQIEDVYQTFALRNNQFIRSGIYRIINSSPFINDYVDYYIDGIAITRKRDDDDREKTTTADESIQLQQGLMQINTPAATKKVLDYFSQPDELKRAEFYHKATVLSELVNNAIKIYSIDQSIYNHVFDLYQSLGNYVNHENISIVASFFEKSWTSWEAFLSLWHNETLQSWEKHILLAGLASKSVIEKFLEACRNHTYTFKDLETLHQILHINVSNQGTKLLEILEEGSEVLGSPKLSRPAKTNHKTIQDQRLQESFDLIFTPDIFKESITKLFTDIGANEASFNQMWKTLHSDSNSEYNYPELSIEIFRDRTYKKDRIKLSEVLQWIDNPVLFQKYQIHKIYEYLKNKSQVNISPTQKDFIQRWVEDRIPSLDIVNAIKKSEDVGTGYTSNWTTIYVWFFIKKFKITIPEHKLYDFTMFVDWERQTHDSNDNIIHHLEHLVRDKVALKKRVVENLQSKIEVDEIWKNNASYAIDRNLSQAHPFILKSLSEERKYLYDRMSIAKQYYLQTGDDRALLDILNDSQIDELYWSVITLLATNPMNETELKLHLNKILTSGNDADKLTAAKNLMRLDDLVGLKYYSEHLHDVMELKEDILYNQVYFSGIKRLDAIPLLLELILLSRNPNFKQGQFISLESAIVDILNKISMSSEQNLIEVKSKIHAFIEKYRLEDEGLNYLYHAIKRMEEQFYHNQTQTMTLEQSIVEIDRLSNHSI